MKKKITRILGIGLTLVLAVTFVLGLSAPVAAADYEENEWGEWGLPDTDADTNIGPIAIAPDGVIYAAIHWYDDDDDKYYWKVAMSDDNGYSWDDTEWDDIESDASGYVNGVASIVISPNFEDDELIYLGIWEDEDGDPAVVRLEDAGDGDVVVIKDLIDSEGDEADVLFNIDVWYDEDEDACWIAAATDLDVLILLDETFEDWRDQELASGGDYWVAYEVAFAPDFEDSELLWAVVDDMENSISDDFMVTATVSPGKWGQEIGPVDLGIHASMWLAMDFPDDYDSDPDEGTCIVYIACSSPDGGDVYLIEGVDADDGPSNAIALLDLAGEGSVNFTSIAVSGEYGDEYILAGELYNPIVWISDDGGMDWDDADKNPTGDSWTHVIMGADVVWDDATYDPEDSMSFAATWGEESALSRSDPNEDGDLSYNQVGMIDTCIDDILDIAIHPEFPDPTIFLLLTHNDTNGTDSLWLTENGDSDEPDYIRLLCGYDGDPGNFDTDGLKLVEYSWDAEAIYLHGLDEGGDSSVWKSTDDGESFGSERDVRDDAEINDWVITDSKTIYAATDQDGFYLSTNSGLSWTPTDVDGEMNDIALSPDFEDGEGFIALGSMDGKLYLSDNDGDTFDDAEEEEGADLTGAVYVAFDADFADADADGYMLIYAASQGELIQEGEIADTDDVDWGDLEDDDNEEGKEIYCTGLQVAADNALYAVGTLEEEEVEVTAVDGMIEITGDNSSAVGDVDIDDLEIDILDGDFTDGDEIYSILDHELEVTVFGIEVTVSGSIWIRGETSGDEARVDLDDVEVDTTSGTFNNSDDDCDVTSYTDGDLEVVETTEESTSGVARLLLHETNSEWESAMDDDLTSIEGLWLTLGSNILWALDGYDGELWLLEDTLSGSPTLSSPPDGYKSDEEEQMRVSWESMRGIDEDYHVKYHQIDPDVYKSIYTDDTSILLTQLSDTSEYRWKVRAAPQSQGDDNADHETWSSRWSGYWTFHTALGEPPWTPTLYTPGGIWQYSGIEVELMPAFSWESARRADSYQFVLADNAEFTSPLVNKKVPESAYNLDFELEYNKNYFWRVMAYKGTEAISAWSDVGAFTTIDEPAPPPPPPVEVAPPAPPAAPIVLPTPIPPYLLWTIIGVGAALVIAVIVLIVRTRRAV